MSISDIAWLYGVPRGSIPNMFNELDEEYVVKDYFSIKKRINLPRLNREINSVRFYKMIPSMSALPKKEYLKLYNYIFTSTTYITKYGIKEFKFNIDRFALITNSLRAPIYNDFFRLYTSIPQNISRLESLLFKFENFIVMSIFQYHYELE